jgi:hypothetical protein
MERSLGALTNKRSSPSEIIHLCGFRSVLNEKEIKMRRRMEESNYIPPRVQDQVNSFIFGQNYNFEKPNCS